MLCIGSQSFIYARISPILEVPPKGAADMFSLKPILDGLREAALSCTGSPHSRRRQLAALRTLDAHLLKDIGLTPEEAKQALSLRGASLVDRPRRVAGMAPSLNR
jgi:hypothetical protein